MRNRKRPNLPLQIGLHINCTAIGLCRTFFVETDPVRHQAAEQNAAYLAPANS